MNQKVTDLFDRALPPHQPGVVVIEYQKICHALGSRAGDSDFPVIRSGNDSRENPVCAAIARNDSDGKVDSAQLLWKAVFGCAELRKCRSNQPANHRISTEKIREFAALTWRGQHHDTPEFGQLMCRQVLPQNYAAKRVSDEVDPGIGVGSLPGQKGV